MKKLKNLFKDEKARIPFSVIGVFLILGSSFTAAYVTRLEKDKTVEVASTLDFNEVEQVLRYVEADIARSLSYAGMFALQTIGPNPVISSSINNSATRDYSDNDRDGKPDLDMNGTKLGDSVKFNINWAKNIIRYKLNEYLKANFMDDRCRYLDYIVNIRPTVVGLGPVLDWDEINFNEIFMDLDRAVPDTLEDLMIYEDDQNYETYWEASVFLNITLIDLKTGETRDFKINPTGIITSRFPFMMYLTNTYINTINGDDSFFSNKLGNFVTLISEIYTEARALIQWSQGPNKIKNIVANDWLKYITNCGLAVEEFMVFNSVDPMALIDLARNVDDLTEGNKELMEKDDFSVFLDTDKIKDQIVEDVTDELNGNLDPGETNYTIDDVNDMIEDAESTLDDQNMIKSVQYIAEELLYDVTYTYYYHLVNENNEPCDKFYNVVDPAFAYIITHTQEEYEDKGVRYTDTANPDYYFILGKPGATSDEDVFDRVINYNNIKQDVKDVVITQLSNDYNAVVTNSVSRHNYKDIGYGGGWNPDYSHGDKLISHGTWVFVSSICNGGCIGTGDKLNIAGHTESWTVTYKRSDEFEICTKYNATSKTCEESITEYHDYYQTHVVTFDMAPSYPANNVDNVFNSKTDVFNMADPHNITTRSDNNLEIVLYDYPEFFENNVRDSVLENYNKNSVDDKTYLYGDGVDYSVEWVKAKNGPGDKGSVVVALAHIISMIKNHENDYSNASQEYNGESTTLDFMDAGRQAMLNTFLGFKDYYNYEESYHMNNDLSDDFISVGSKTVAKMRAWFTKKIEEKLNDSSLKNKFESEIDKQIDGETGVRFDEYNELQNDSGYSNCLEELSDIGNGQGLQCGLAMTLTHGGSSYEVWNEEVAFAIDQVPNYFDYKEDDNKTWYFNVKNICLLGPTGLPLLPIPPIPWFCTINLWSLEVEGAYEKFKLVDTLDEAHANPLFGHDGQIFERIDNNVYDRICTGELLGKNERIEFKFWTMNFAIVPPNKLPIGDVEGGYIEENP